MTLVLDSGGISVLAGNRAVLQSLRRRDAWPPQVPAVVLAESLTGDHRRDFHANQLIRMCQVHDVHESLAREAASLRHATTRADSISAVDAIVVAFAARQMAPVVLTADPDHLGALAVHASQHITISGT